MKNSKIQWTDHTFNPWVGCEKISPACDHCYAESWAKRAGSPELWQGKRRRTHARNWREPLKWDREAAATGERRRVFCASLADVFDNRVPDEWRADLFRLIRQTRNLDWLLLTKRIGNVTAMIDRALSDAHLRTSREPFWPWPNVWIGATICNQAELDRDVPKLINTPARIRFLSMEPLLGPLSFEGRWIEHANPAVHENWLERIDWGIVGGESGGGARAMELEWAQDVVDQFGAFGKARFVKQLGGAKDKRGELEDFPESLRIREFPRAA